MRALKGGIPRGLRSHRGVSGVVYGRYARATVTRLGPLAGDAAIWLREAGRLVVRLDQHQAEAEALEAALADGAGHRRRLKLQAQQRTLERRQARARAALEAAERRLEELAVRNGHPPSLSEYLASKGAAR